MKNRVLLVVGDKFLQFAVGKDVITLSQLRSLLTLPQVVSLDRGLLTAIPGQGLGDGDVKDILDLALTSPHRDHFDLSLWRNRPKRADRRLSHKHRPENTLISEPRRVAGDVFEMDLLLDENCDVMGDHQTGQHLQGMVLMEAARQAFLAVTEAFFLPQDNTRFYFVINKFAADYKRFAFPLDATIRYEITAKDTSNPLRQSFAADINIMQCGMKAAGFTTEFTTFEDARISAREDALARDALAEYMSARAQQSFAVAA
jgi:hypothetical protein